MKTQTNNHTKSTLNLAIFSMCPILVFVKHYNNRYYIVLAIKSSRIMRTEGVKTPR